MILIRRFPISVWAFAITLAAVTSLPYLLGALNAPDGFRYSGAPALPAGLQWDFNSHMAKMWQGERGHWDYHLLFTHEAHPGLPLIQGFYVALGMLTRVIPLSLPLLFHLARLVLTLIMVLALWSWAAYFFQTRLECWICLLSATIVSGWSWLLLLLAPGMTAQVSPIEFWLTDAFNLMGALFVPHFAAAIILQIVIVLAFAQWIQQAGTGRLIILTLTLTGEAIIQPYSVLLLGSLLLLLSLYHIRLTRKLSWKRALQLVPPLGLYGVVVLYQYLAMQADPVWSNFVEQNQTRSPAVVYYLLGYLPLLLPFVFALAQRKLEKSLLIPLCWIIVVALLVYAPFPTQRRYLLGVQTPLAVLATWGWSRAILPRFSRQRYPLLFIVYFAFASIASVLMLLANTTSLARADHLKVLYYSSDEIQGYDWLMTHTDIDDLVFAASKAGEFGSGGKVVAVTGRRVFTGHWIETAHFKDKVLQIEQFYDPETTDAWRQNFLEEINASYVWYDEHDQSIGCWNPSTAAYLEAAFVSKTVIIYRVQ